MLGDGQKLTIPNINQLYNLSKIHLAYLNHRDKIRMAKLEQCCQELRQVAIMLYKQGIEPTRRYVTRHLRKPAYFREPMVITALDTVRQELGLE